MKKWKQRVLSRLQDAFGRVDFNHRVNVLVGDASYYVEEQSYDYSFDGMWGNTYTYDAGKSVIVRLPYELTGEDEEVIAVGEEDFLRFLTRNFTPKEIISMELIEFSPF